MNIIKLLFREPQYYTLLRIIWTQTEATSNTSRWKSRYVKIARLKTACVVSPPFKFWQRVISIVGEIACSSNFVHAQIEGRTRTCAEASSKLSEVGEGEGRASRMGLRYGGKFENFVALKFHQTDFGR